MERLTKRDKNGVPYIYCGNRDLCRADRENVTAKLANYEDLEEDKRLALFPYPIGSQVYFSNNGEPKAGSLIGYFWQNQNPQYLISTNEKCEEDLECLISCDYGTFFDTEEKCQKYIKEKIERGQTDET